MNWHGNAYDDGGKRLRKFLHVFVFFWVLVGLWLIGFTLIKKFEDASTIIFKVPVMFQEPLAQEV